MMSTTPNLLQRVIKRFGVPQRVREEPDPTPMAPPVGYKSAPSLAEQIREMVRSEKLAQELAAQGVETFEEADDFDVADDYEVQSPWENEFDPPIKDMLKDGAAEVEKKAKADSSAPKPKSDPEKDPKTADPPKADPSNKEPPKGGE